jgi:UDP-N-acetylmuramate dehydrogenase
MTIFKKDISLARYSSYRIGGTAQYFCEPKSVSELQIAVAKARAEHVPIFVLGGGTNLVISDHGFRGVVIKPAFQGLKALRGEIRVGAGVRMADLLQCAAEEGLSGLEWAGGLPGSVGGAVRGNAGAFGGEIKDVVASVESLYIKGVHPKLVTRIAPDCRFGYRTSIFKERSGEEIILSAVLRLGKGDKKAISRSVKEKIQYRKDRHPMEYPNIGSIFKNVELKRIPENLLPLVQQVIKNDPIPVVPTAYLIAEAGLKGISCGGAMVSPKHPNFIVNTVRATAKDVKKLIGLVKATVEEKFGITLEEEVIYV